MSDTPIIADPETLHAVYADLKRIARGMLRQERQRDLMQTTMLVNEVFLKLLGRREADWSWESRAHFFDAAVRNMRWILVDQARQRKSRIQPAAVDGIEAVDSIVILSLESPESLLVLDDLLERLRDATSERIARVAELRVFLGLTVRETATLLDVSTSTVERDWVEARRWLADRIREDHRSSREPSQR